MTVLGATIAVTLLAVIALLLWFCHWIGRQGERMIKAVTGTVMSRW